MWVKVQKLIASLATWSWQAIPLFWASALSCLRRQGKENPGHLMLWEGRENTYLIWARAWSEKFQLFPNISYWRNSMNRTGSRGMESHKGIESKFRFQQQYLLTPGERRVWQRWAGLCQLKENTSSYTWKHRRWRGSPQGTLSPLSRYPKLCMAVMPATLKLCLGMEMDMGRSQTQTA